jgi:hypothetical protein
VPRFERGDGGTRRRLGDVERLGGAGHMLALGDANENTKLFEGHIDLLQGSIYRSVQSI